MTETATARPVETAYKRAFNPIKQNYRIITLSMILMIGGAIGGLVFGLQTVEKPDQADSDPSVSNGQSEPTTPTLIEVFTNNLSVAIATAIGGATFGLVTVGLLLFNGFFLGTLAARAYVSSNVREFILLLAPHAIFELPALWIAGAIGFRIGYSLYLHLRGHRDVVFSAEESQSLYSLAAISVLLLVIAAVVEVRFTFTLIETLARENAGYMFVSV